MRFYLVTAEVILEADSAVHAEQVVGDLIRGVAHDWRLVVEQSASTFPDDENGE